MNELFFVRWHSAWGSTPSPTKAFLDNPDSPHLCSPHLTSRPTYRGPKGSNLFRKFLRVFVKYRSKPPPPQPKTTFLFVFWGDLGKSGAGWPKLSHVGHVVRGGARPGAAPDAVVNALQLPREPNRNAVFQAMLAYQNTPGQGPPYPTLSAIVTAGWRS